jgi:nicotinate-nucleotide pyrophosphorylase (carboxylating)
MNLFLPKYSSIQQQVKSALNEDIGSGDVTARLISDTQQVTAEIICRSNAILSGCKWVDEVFLQIDEDMIINWHFFDGNQIQGNEILCTIKGNAQHILTAERTALNFLQTLSATATITRQYVDAVKQTSCKILDTRKTIPGLRNAQKYAVRCGGGSNHRIGLYDMVLIKENHIHAAGSIRTAVEQSKKINSGIPIEVEVETLNELEQALDANVERILLDNMSIETMKQAVKMAQGKTPLEASGGINIDAVQAVAQSGVDYISVGALTKNINAIDLSLRITSR